MDVIVIKMNSGEHVIGAVKDETDTLYVLENICGLFPDPTGENQFKVLPTFNMFNGAVEFLKSNVVYSGKPQEELEAQFISAFSGVLIPSSQILHG